MKQLGIIGKMVTGIIIVSCITYGTSAFFIFVLKDKIAPEMPQLTYVSAILSLGVLWTALLGWLGARYFVRPLIRLTNVMMEASTGNLRVLAPKHRSGDEINRLHVAFEALLGNLKNTIRDIAEQSDHSNRQTESLNHAMQQAASQIEQITMTVEHITEDAKNQDKLSQSSLDFVREGVETSGSVNRHAKEAVHQSQHLEQTLNAGGQQIMMLVDGLQKMEQASRASLQSINDLKLNADEINEISEIVGKIAAQTHLLSLNASIEAAKAGEFGTGFSVVATEIRKLSDHTLAASDDIRDRIQQILGQIDRLALAIEEQAAEAYREASQGERVGQSLHSVSEAVNAAVHHMEEIAKEVQYQAQQIGRTFDHTKNIAELGQTVSSRARNTLIAAQEQLAVMQEIAAATEELKDKAKQMERKIQQFEW